MWRGGGSIVICRKSALVKLPDGMEERKFGVAGNIDG
jgi:hypothetical protein